MNKELIKPIKGELVEDEDSRFVNSLSGKPTLVKYVDRRSYNIFKKPEPRNIKLIKNEDNRVYNTTNNYNSNTNITPIESDNSFIKFIGNCFKIFGLLAELSFSAFKEERFSINFWSKYSKKAKKRREMLKYREL